MLIVSPALMLFVFALMFTGGLLIGLIGRSLRKQSGDVQARLGILVRSLKKRWADCASSRALMQKYQKERFGAENDGYANALIRLLRRRDLASPVSEFLGIFIVAILLWFGARRVFASESSAETFLAFLYAFFNVLDPAKSLSQAFYNIKKGMGAVERV
ncbi:MAG: ABC transporter transmembrane domain-containing protein [Saprospiraceae bacterium]